MGTDVAEVQSTQDSSCSVKVHRAMCTRLRILIDRILGIFQDIEAARPRCSGIQALSRLRDDIDKAELLLQDCSQSSKFYLAIKGDKTVSRFERSRKQLEQSLGELQTMVPMILELEISQIVDDLRRVPFTMDSFELEAWKVLRALLQKDESILSLFGNSEIRVLQFAAPRIHLTSQEDLLIEKRSIKKMLDKVSDTDSSKRTTLRYLQYLLKKHDKLVLEGQEYYASTDLDGSFSSVLSAKKSVNGHYVDMESRLRYTHDEAQPDLLHRPVIPEEFKCLLSSKLMHDPVIISSGQTFERIFIQRWFDDGHDTCPKTRTMLLDLSLKPNTDMRNRILKWCEEQGISSYEPTPQTSGFSFLDVSSNSISSCGSLAGLHIQIDLSSLSLGSKDTSFNSSNFLSKNEGDLGLTRSPIDNSSPEFNFFSSRHEIETTLLSNINPHPWESQCMAIEDVQIYLDHYTHADVPISSKNFVEPVVGFLKAAVNRQDVRAQTAGSHLFLTGLLVSRTAIQCIKQDVYYILGSFLGTAMTKDVLAILDLSVESSCGMELAKSGALSSILKFLDTQDKEFHEIAIKILYKLSLSGNPCLPRFIPLGCIHRLVPFLRDSALAGPCVVILEKLFITEEARTLAAKTEGCIAAIVELLESDNCEEQEHGVFLLLTLCSQCNECRKLVMEEEIVPTLVYLKVNGSDRGKMGASELLQLLDVADEDEEEDSSYVGSTSVIPDKNSEKQMPTKKNGLFSKFTARLKKS